VYEWLAEVKGGVGDAVSIDGKTIRELPDDIRETGEEQGHGRIEKRKVRTVTELSWLQSGRRLPIIWAAVLPHHRAYRSVHGGSMDYV
jgi:hypothetical protein